MRGLFHNVNGELGQRNRNAVALVTAAVALLVFSGTLLADEAASLFSQGNQRYSQGDYEGAIEAYEAILQQGFESWQVYYNLGNAYYKIGKLGKAILNLERARRLNPRDDDIQYNLDLANLKVVDRINAIPELFFVRWMKSLARLFSAATLGWTALVLYAVTVVLWITRLLATRGKLRSVMTVVVVPIVVLWVLAGSLAAYRVYLDRAEKFAVVMVDKVDVRSAPESSSTEVFVIHEGVKVRLDRQVQEWAKIRLADGKIGWIPVSAIERI
jgi:tetratricopeptide (TPR) repeat protein